MSKELYKIDVSPTKKLIDEMDDRIHEFDINRITEWNTENMRKFKSFVKRFDNYEAVYNIMLLDK
jgi:adenosyl cobinamide kinase/adenosyl cobinamide phosphate guanylyltransferase